VSTKDSRLILLITAVFVSFAAYGEERPYPAEVYEALESAGDNRPELEEVLEHFANEDDTLKLKAACFLIGNMEGHCYATYALRDSTGNEIDFSALNYPDFESLLSAFDSLESKYGVLDFKRKELIYDIGTITADFLIEQIDYAFRSWREKPWARALSFDHFRDYILPYRGSNEPLERWREYFREKYSYIDSMMTDTADPIEAAVLINDDIKSWYTFDRRYYFHPTDEGLSEMLESRMGRCEDMTNLTIYAMRANGLAVTSDYTPCWANAGNNHAWNAIVTPEDKVIPFMGAEANPGQYSLRYKPAKVYRKMFGEQKQNLAFQEKKQEEVPGWLAGKCYIDVTDDYVDVCDVTVTFEKKVPDSVDIAYLCVFNSGEWKAIHWGRIENGAAIFTDMGVDIVYMPALYLNKEIVPYCPPFILRRDGGQNELRASEDITIPATMKYTANIKLGTPAGGTEKTPLKSGHEYELFCWKEGWQSLGKSVANKEALVYSEVPSGALFQLVARDSDNEERIFTIEDSVQVWW
jgi:hypothetical protein